MITHYKDLAPWQAYWKEFGPQLAKRKDTFEKIFDQLLCIDNPVIIETGTYREENNYAGDGCSTLLFDNFIECTGSGTLISIDIDPKACALARNNTKHAEVICGDSVETLALLDGSVDLLYLDSYNIQNWYDDWAPASHHLKELFAAKNLLVSSDTLIVVDDNLTAPDGRRLGKGRLIYELMDSLGIDPLFDEYQVGWIWEEEYE